MSDEPEEWRPVVGWEGLYEVSSLGRVRSLDRINWQKFGKTRRSVHHRGQLLKPTLGDDGYFQLTLSGHGKKVLKKPHRLVCEAFVGPAPHGHEVGHIDGTRTNNRATNLRWVTREENMAHKVEHGTHNRGARSPVHVLSEDAVVAIRLLPSGMRGHDIAAQFGVSKSQVNRIRARSSRKFE